MSLIYVSDMGFDSPLERFELILTAAEKDEAAVWVWLDEDGSRDGLMEIINAKRPVRRTHEKDMDDAFGPLDAMPPDLDEQRDGRYGDLGLTRDAERETDNGHR